MCVFVMLLLLIEGTAGHNRIGSIVGSRSGEGGPFACAVPSERIHGFVGLGGGFGAEERSELGGVSVRRCIAGRSGLR